MTTWHARVVWRAPSPTNDDTVFTIMDDLDEHAPLATVARDHTSGTVAITLDADTVEAAATEATRRVREVLAHRIDGSYIDGVEILSDTDLDTELARPLFPDVVGYAEIADMGGVSRQRARQWAQIPGFPPPVITTAQGPLRSRAAVAAWLDARKAPADA